MSKIMSNTFKEKAIAVKFTKTRWPFHRCAYNLKLPQLVDRNANKLLMPRLNCVPNSSIVDLFNQSVIVSDNYFYQLL